MNKKLWLSLGTYESQITSTALVLDRVSISKRVQCVGDFTYMRHCAIYAVLSCVNPT